MKYLIGTDSPLVGTGLGKSAFNLGRELERRGERVAYCGNGYLGVPDFDFAAPIWPWVRGHAAGLQAAIGTYEPEVVVLLGDAWHFQFLYDLRQQLERERRCPTFLLNLTVDTSPFPLTAHSKRVLDAPHLLAATTEFGVRVLAGEDGDPTRVPMHYRASHVPLGVDPAFYNPDGPPSRAEARVTWPDERAVIGWVGNNQFRKHPVEAMAVLKELQVRGRKACLWMRTQRSGEFELYEAAEHLGLRITAAPPRGVPECDVYLHEGHLTEIELAAAYRRMDVFLSCSTAGAPELPLLEARACGTPTVAVDCSCFADVADWVARPGDPQWVSPTVTHATVDVWALADQVAHALTVGPRWQFGPPTWADAVDALETAMAGPVPDWVPGIVL